MKDLEGIQVLPSGKVRVRYPDPSGVRRHVGTYPNVDEAIEVRDHLRAKRALVKPEGRHTLRSWGAAWLDRRDRVQHVAGIKHERGRWALHIIDAPFADWPLEDIRPPNVRAWLDRLALKRSTASANRGEELLSPGTQKHCLNLLYGALQSALEEGLIPTNPAAGFRIKRRRYTHEPWTYLPPHEQARLTTCEAIPEAHRIILALMILIGWRLGEFANQEIIDVHLDAEPAYIVIRYGGPGHAPTKGGKPRTIYLDGEALRLVRRWLEILPSYTASKRYPSGRNPHGLLFPTVRGKRLPAHEAPRWWEAARAAAGLDKPELRHDGMPVRFHDLRHTCASSLVAGWWGRRWSLEEVRKQLGHSSITVTQRYAHLADSVLADAWKGTRGGPTSGGSATLGHARDTAAESETTSIAAPLPSKPRVAGSNPAGRAPGITGQYDVGAEARVPRVSRADLLRALASKSPEAYELARHAAEEFLALGLAADALTILRADPLWSEAAVRLAEALPNDAADAGEEASS